MSLPYTLDVDPPVTIGAVVLQADETLEHEMRHLMPLEVRLLVSRVPSGLAVTPETLEAMAGELSRAAELFPRGLAFDAIAYGCTSGAAQIGPSRVARLIRDGAPAGAVTDPLTALIAACRAQGVTRLALLSPYMESVSARLRDQLTAAGIATPVFGSFDEPEEAKVARISARSLRDAATGLVAGQEVDALFMSCTNLRTVPVIPDLSRDLGLPVWSSNLVLGWHLLASTPLAVPSPGDLL